MPKIFNTFREGFAFSSLNCKAQIMFSSNPSISINPNANLQSPNYLHCAPLFASYGNGDVLLNHIQFYPLTGLILPAANHHSLTNMGFTGSDTRVMNAAHCAHASINRKPAVKKDRHSKIFTAKGLRDRRVRLSVEIAREFFDLQDMLGFDKASKTLEWLFNKSKTAIKEVSELKIPRNHGELEEATATDSKSKQMEGISEERKIMEKLTKESRYKARARARERTKEKLCKKISDTSPHQMLTQFRSLSQIKGNCEESSSYIVAHDHDHHHHQVQEPCSHKQSNQAPTERKQSPSSSFVQCQCLSYLPCEQLPNMSLSNGN